MIKFIKKLFKNDKQVIEPETQEKLHDLEELAQIHSEALVNLIKRFEEVKKFRDIYTDDLRVISNAIANLDKRAGQIEELFQHLNYQVAELEQTIDPPDDEDTFTSFSKDTEKSNLN